MKMRHARMAKASVLLLWFLSAVSHVKAEDTTSNGATASAIRSLKVKLIDRLDANRLKDGSDFRVRIADDWVEGSCHLQPGSTLQGQVIHVIRRSKLDKTSQFQIGFSVTECMSSSAKPVRFTMIALIGPIEGEDNGQGPPLSSIPGLFTGGVLGAPAIRNGDSANTIDAYQDAARRKRTSPDRVLIGQVLNAPKIELQVGAGDEGATVVSTSRGDAHIEAGSTLVLVEASRLKPRAEVAKTEKEKASAATGPSAPHTEETGKVTPLPSPKELPDESEICSTACLTLTSLEGQSLEKSRAVSAVAIKGLGYLPHQVQNARSFTHETTVTFLDEHHLLCTFDPHRLRARSSDGTEPSRSVRAVLIDPKTLQIQRVLEWRVRGADAYLWRFGRGMVLVHMEHALLLLDHDLKTIRSIRVDGPVAWVVSSPSNDHTAIGIIKRTYSMETVREMTSHGEDVIEDIDVSIFDAKWNLLGRSVRPSYQQPPVLSDTGELRADHVGVGKWKISELAWNRQERVLATVHSTCRPQISAQELKLTFLTGCTADRGSTWYRMLNADGKPVLKADSSADEIAQKADAAAAGRFAIRVVKTTTAMVGNEQVKRTDLQEERIAVFSNSDGKRLGSVVTDDFVLAENSFALSPGGDEMAIVGKEAIRFYKIGAR